MTWPVEHQAGEIQSPAHNRKAAALLSSGICMCLRPDDLYENTSTPDSWIPNKGHQEVGGPRGAGHEVPGGLHPW